MPRLSTTDVPHLPLEGEENPDQLDLEGRIFKRATNGLIIERATQLGEALDELAQAKANVEFRETELDTAFLKLKEKDQFVEAHTMAGSVYMFYAKNDRKLVKKCLVSRKAEAAIERTEN
ncbi:MAG: hypothetical protein QME60_01240 [Verrucomicrobiota bacterium]|nr:hypothetical protein [Verrucomicrobiota bacterium]